MEQSEDQYPMDSRFISQTGLNGIFLSWLYPKAYAINIIIIDFIVILNVSIWE